MNARSRPFALKPEKESGGGQMEGIIDMGYGDNTNPWDILKAGWKNLTGSDRKANPAYPAPSATTGTAANPYADPYTRNRAISDAIESGRRQSARQPAPFMASPPPSITENRAPVFKTELMSTIHDAALKNLPLIASNPYKDIPFYKNNAVVNAWYRKINATPRDREQSSTGIDTGRYHSGLEGTIAGEPYARRAYAVPERKTAPAVLQSETGIDAQGYTPVIDKLRPYAAIKNLIDPEQLKQTEEAIGRFLNNAQAKPAQQTNDKSINTGTSIDGGQHADLPAKRNSGTGIYTPSGAAGQKTAAFAGTDELPPITSETEQAAQTGADLHEGLKTAVPDLGVGAIVAGGKVIKDGVNLAAALTGSDSLRDFGEHIEKNTEKFIENSGSETLNRQRKAIRQTLKDPNASGADLAKAFIENPYGTLFDAGTEMAGVALPAGGAKLAQKGIQLGMKAAPKIAELGAKALPCVPHTIQTLQGVGDSLNKSEGESAGNRALKALGAGAITAAGSLASGGGIAGEVGKRLTNQITNGTVRTATDMAAAVGKQAFLGATQNTAGHISDKAVEGELPDTNLLGKLAVKGAVDGTVAGASLHHAVVPTEGRALRQVEAAGNGNKNAHTIPKHGTGTTLEQQKDRATKGIEPDGTQSYRTDSSKWQKNVDIADGIAVAKRRWEEQRRINPDQNDEITIIFDKPVGEGYLKKTDTLIKSNEAVFRFNEKGDLITSYPLLPKNRKK